MFYRCLGKNAGFGDCKEPRHIKQRKGQKYCKLDYKTCGNYSILQPVWGLPSIKKASKRIKPKRNPLGGLVVPLPKDN